MASKLIPVRQGEIDGMCGVYAVLNACRLLHVAGDNRTARDLRADQTKRLFRTLCLSRSTSGLFPDIICNGTEGCGMSLLIAVAQRWSVNHSRRVVEMSQPRLAWVHPGTTGPSCGACARATCSSSTVGSFRQATAKPRPFAPSLSMQGRRASKAASDFDRCVRRLSADVPTQGTGSGDVREEAFHHPVAIGDEIGALQRRVAERRLAQWRHDSRKEGEDRRIRAARRVSEEIGLVADQRR